MPSCTDELVGTQNGRHCHLGNVAWKEMTVLDGVPCKWVRRCVAGKWLVSYTSLLFPHSVAASCRDCDHSEGCVLLLGK